MANVSAQIVNPLDPTSIVAQQQLARQQAMAQALREQSLQPIDYDHKGAISPWQGLAKALQGAGAGFLQGKADAKTLALSKAVYDGQRGSFGLPGSTPPFAPPRDTSQDGPMQGGSPPAPPIMPGGQPGFGADMSAAISAQPASVPPAPPTAMPSVGPSGSGAPPAPQGAPPRNTNVLPGMDPESSYALSVQRPEVYDKLREASGTPTDAVKNLLAAGLQQGTPEFNAALGAINKKAGFIAPTNIREGGAAIFNDGSGRVMTAPKTEVGMQNDRDPQGNVIGQSNVPGALGAIQASELARGIGKADATPSIGYDANGNPVATTAGAMVRQSTPGGIGAGPGGGAVAPAQRPGFAPAQGTAGTNSANQFNGVVAGAQGSQDRAFNLSKIGELAKGLNTGAGAGHMSEIKSGVNTFSRSLGFGAPFDDASVAKTQEIQKLASTLAQQQSTALGGKSGSTDAKLSAAFASLPDANKAPGAIRDIVTYLKGNESAIQGKAAAAAGYQQTHGGDSFPQFSNEWQRAYEPRIYQWMQGGPAAFAAEVQKLPPPQRAAMATKYRALKALGALPQ